MIQLNSLDNVKHAQSCISNIVDGNKDIEPLHDLSWLLAEGSLNEDIYVCFYQNQDDVTAYCVLRKQFRPINVFFGEYSIFSYSLNRYEMWSNVTFKSGISDAETITKAFLVFISTVIKPDEGLSIEGLPVESILYKEFLNYNSMHLGKPYLHQSIAMPATYDGYLDQLSNRSRKSILYSQRKAKKDFSVKLLKCDSVEKIDSFLDSAIAISKTTYQWNLLGLGLRDREALKATLLKWQKQDALCCYILQFDDVPVSFMLGYIYKSTYYYIDVGFNPEWSKYSVGSVLQLEVLEELYSLISPPTSFDFSTGYGEHKARFGNVEQNEVNMMLLSNTLKNKFRVLVYNFFSKMSDSLVELLEKLGIKKRLKKILRRIA